MVGRLVGRLVGSVGVDRVATDRPFSLLDLILLYTRYYVVMRFRYCYYFHPTPSPSCGFVNPRVNPGGLDGVVNQVNPFAVLRFFD